MCCICQSPTKQTAMKSNTEQGSAYNAKSTGKRTGTQDCSIGTVGSCRKTDRRQTCEGGIIGIYGSPTDRDLYAGDTIFFWDPLYAAGDKRGRVKAVVLVCAMFSIPCYHMHSKIGTEQCWLIIWYVIVNTI